MNTTAKSSQKANAPAEVAHTPGPWSVANSSGIGELGANDLVVVGFPEYKQSGLKYDGNIICAVAPAHRITSTDEANAILLAAAPELLAMVKEYAEQADCGDGGEHHDDAQGFTPKANCWHCRAVELVAKATGEAQP